MDGPERKMFLAQMVEAELSGDIPKGVGYLPGPAFRVDCCGSVIQSQARHDLVFCKCGTCFVDGGDAYTRRGGLPHHFTKVEEESNAVDSSPE